MTGMVSVVEAARMFGDMLNLGFEHVHTFSKENLARNSFFLLIKSELFTSDQIDQVVELMLLEIKTEENKVIAQTGLTNARALYAAGIDEPAKAVS